MSLNREPGREALVYHPSKVAWATAEFVRKPPPIAVTYSVYLLLLAAVTGLAYTWIARIPVSIKTQGVIVSEQKAIPIVAIASAQVASLNVKDNQMVKKGDVLLTTDLQLSDAQFNKIARQVATVQKFIDLDRKDKCNSTCVEKLRALSFEYFSLDAKGSIKDTLVQFQDMTREYVSAKTNSSNLGTVLAEQYRTIKTSREKLAMIKSKNAVELLAVDVERLTSLIGTTQAQIADRRQSTKMALKQTRDRLDVRLKTLVPTFTEFRSQQSLIAPANGVVTNLKVSAAGQQIAPGQPVLDLIPADSLLIAEVAVQNQDISKVSRGMPVLIKLNALSERDYGVVKGTIIEVPVNVSAGQGGPATYAIPVRLDRQAFQKGGQEFPFRLGMTLSAQIVSSRERILVLGAKQILNIKDQILEN